jgi:hypothetical protein
VCPGCSKNKKIGRNEQKIESYKRTKGVLLTARPKREIVFTKKLVRYKNKFHKLIFRGAL